MEFKSKRLTFEELSERLRENEPNTDTQRLSFTAVSKAGNWETTTI
jgi:hypothetical protein